MECASGVVVVCGKGRTRALRHTLYVGRQWISPREGRIAMPSAWAAAEWRRGIRVQAYVWTNWQAEELQGR